MHPIISKDSLTFGDASIGGGCQSMVVVPVTIHVHNSAPAALSALGEIARFLASLAHRLHLDRHHGRHHH